MPLECRLSWGLTQAVRRRSSRLALGSTCSCMREVCTPGWAFAEELAFPLSASANYGTHYNLSYHGATSA